jgi:GNAT superfamily N-acetyltransferase
MASSTVMRPATRADVPALATLVRACDASQRAWAGPEIPLPSRTQHELEWDLRLGRADAWILLAQDEAAGAVVGVVAFADAPPADDAPARRVAQLNALFVDPGHWRRGIARELLARAEVAMRAGGYERAQLWTLAGSPAEQVYRALGWEPDGRRDRYAPMGLATVGYVRSL